MVNILPYSRVGSPLFADFYEIWRRSRSSRQRGHVHRIFSQLAQGLWSCDTSKIAVCLSEAASPLQRCCTTVLHCDKTYNVFTLIYATLVEDATDTEMADLLKEMDIMKTIGQHTNLRGLLGCCTQSGKCFSWINPRHWNVFSSGLTCQFVGRWPDYLLGHLQKIKVFFSLNSAF